MMRKLAPLALAALILLPDWASAFGRRRMARCGQRYAPVAAVPLYPVYPAYPAVAYCPPVVVGGPYYTETAPTVAAPEMATPQTAVPTAPPKVTPEVPKPADPKIPGVTPGLPKLSLETSDPAVRQAEATTPAPRVATPTVAVPEAPAEATLPRIPPTAVGTEPAGKPAGVKLNLTPSMLPGTDSTPPLALPTGQQVIAKSSPLLNTPAKKDSAVQVVPVASTGQALTAKRSVAFYNLSDRDVTLTVEGETVTLPRRHQICASLKVTFAWKLDDEAARSTTVPADAPGVEVLIRQ